MSVWGEVQEALVQRFVAAWVDGNGDPLCPIQLGNEKEGPDETTWLQLLVQRLPGGPGTMGSPGNRKMDRRGVVFVLLREPPLQGGTQHLTDLAERAAAIFENCRLQPHDIRFAQVEPTDAGMVDGGRWWGQTVEGPFDYESIV